MHPDTASRATTPASGSVEQLYAASYARLVGVLALAAGSRSEAEELVQEAFLRLVPRWEQVSQYEDPEAWVRSVAFRLSVSRWRSLKAAGRTLVRHGVPDDVGPPGEAAVVVQDALAALPLASRQVLVLDHALGLPVEQVARELDLPVGTVKSRLSRARAAAATLIGDLDA